jgi:hypothetical protein
MVQAFVDATAGVIAGATAWDIVQLTRKNPSRPNLRDSLGEAPKKSWLVGSG